MGDNDNDMVTPQSLDPAAGDLSTHAAATSQTDASGNKDANNPSDSRPESPSADSPDESGAKTSAPLQKRRRVTRACDECRRKKIKCDGKQPCTHCTVYSYECTYDQPSNRRRNPAPQYIEALESRLQKAEAVLRTVLPTLDLDDPKFDAHSIKQLVESARTIPRPEPKAAPGTPKLEDDAQLQSMVDRTGALDLDDTGNWDFHGHSSGYVFMRRFRAQFGDQLLPDFKTLNKNRTISQVLESPRSAQSSPYDFNLPAAIDLPPREVAIELCCNTLDDCCALMRPVHRPTFFKRLYALYETEPEQYNNEHVQFLPLLYVVMAVGCLFSKTEDDNTMLDIKGYKEATEQGYQYFNCAKQMLDITDCRDLVSLQAIVFMILFLQSTAKLPTCYAYVGIALRACCRLGLHRVVSHKFNPIELEERKRAFWLVRKMDSYVGAVLGLPQMLSDDDADQEFPTEVDDEYITAEGIQSMPAGVFPLLKATNASTRLTHTLRKVVRYIYPIKGLDSVSLDQRYTISHRRIRELERDLQTWMDELPMDLRPSESANKELARVQQLLRISYAHVQMMIYRPFLHYVSQACQSKNVDKRSFACAAACISVSRNIVHITSEMKRRGLLVGSYWFVMYTTYFAILSLVFFVIENPNSPTGQDILKDATEGRETLASLAKRSMAADRCTLSLSALFDGLPTKLQERRNSTKPVPSTSRKRPPPSAETKQEKQPTSGVATPISLREPTGPPARARTFPSDFLAKIAKRNSMPEAPVMANFHDGVAPQPPMAAFGSPSTASPISPSLDYTPQMANAQIPDLKNVMFPSDNPFAYPNQPISTLESSDGQFSFQDSGMDAFPGPNDHSMYDTPTTSVGQMPQPSPAPNYDFSYQRALNEHPGLMHAYGGTASHFSTPLTDIIMQNTFAGDNSPSHFTHMPHLQDPMTTGTPEISDPGISQNSDEYWNRLHKNDVGMRTGLTPGVESGLNEFYNPESWSANWGTGHPFPNPQ